MTYMEIDMNATKRIWHSPVVEQLDLAATAGGPPGGADLNGQGVAGCSPSPVIANCS